MSLFHGQSEVGSCFCGFNHKRRLKFYGCNRKMGLRIVFKRGWDVANGSWTSIGDESPEIMLGVCFSAMKGFSNGSFSSENVYIRLRRISGIASAMQKERAHLHGSRLLRIFVAERTFVGGR